MAGICHIVGAGPLGGGGLTRAPGDYVIAADGGFDHLGHLRVQADLVVGDFDSLGHIPVHPNVQRLPREKDDTDLLYAVKAGLKLGYTRFLIYGGLGGRLDHTLANLQTLAYLSRRGARGVMLGEGVAATAVTDAELRFSAGRAGVISVFCAGDRAQGVTLEGLKYPLAGATLCGDLPLGVSNEFTGAPVRVVVAAGTLLLIWEEEVETFSAAAAFSP